MTDTTTDVAEARAQEVLIAQICALHPGYSSLHVRAAVEGEMPYMKIRVSTALAAMLAFATAEAASGAGEREEYILPCDVHLPNVTVIKAGCQLATLKVAMEASGRPRHFTTHPRASLPPATDPAIPDGWKLVPVEPTDEMLQEIQLLPEYTGKALRARYAAMLAAAPTIPATGEAEA